VAKKPIAKLTPKEIAEGLLKNTPPTQLSEHWSTSSLIVDQLLGGGIPNNGTIFMWGLPNSGKTTLLYLIMAQMVREGKRPLYVPTEKWDKRYLLNALGLPRDISEEELLKYIWIYSGYGQETTIDFMLKVAQYCHDEYFNVDAIILDSISAFVGDEYAYDIGDPAFGAAAKTNNQMLRRIPKICSIQNIPFIFTGQVRMDMTANNTKGVYYTTPGGKLAMGHACSIELQTKRAATVALKDAPIDLKDIRFAYTMDINVARSSSTGCYGGSRATPVILVTDSIPKIDMGVEILEVGDQYGIFTGKDGKVLIGNVNALSIRFYKGVQLGNYQQARLAINDNPNLAEELFNLVRSEIAKGNKISVVGIPNSFEDIDNVDDAEDAFSDED